MAFTSTLFIFVFAPVSVMTYWITRKINKNLGDVVFLMFNLVLYASAIIKHVPLMLMIVAFTWLIGLVISSLHKKENNKSEINKRRIVLVCGIVLLVSILGYMKYTDFLIGIMDRFVSLDISTINIIEPLGISYITFSLISYLVDIYRKDAELYKVAWNHYYSLPWVAIF